MSDTVTDDPPPVDLARFQPTLPRAVREAAARAEQIARDIGADPDHPPADPALATVANPQTEPPAETASEPPATVPDHAPMPAPAPDHAPVPDTVTDWEQRYNTLQGKYNSEVPQLRQQVSNLQQMMATLARQPAPPPPQPAAPAAVAPEVPQEDVDEFGDPLIAAARRWARAEVAADINSLRDEIKSLRGNAHETQETVNKRTVEGVLDRDVPGWRQINDSQEFVTWLNDTDPFSGHRRMDMLGDAYRRGDARRTAAFFTAFQTQQTAVDPAPAGTHQRQTAPPAATIPLATLAAPGRASTGSPAAGGAPTARVWTRAQIAAFYDRCTRGMYRGREAERARIEAEIFQATNEGRIE